MSIQKIRQTLINLIPIRKLRKKLSYHFGWFPYNYVQPDVKISSIRKLKLEGNVWIGGNGSKLCCEGGIRIGKNTAIGEGCFFITTNHNYKSDKAVPFDNIGIMQPINIAQNVWVGARSKICPGVKIDEGAIVAMGSVVTKSVPKCAIVGGNPAKIIGWRDIDLYEKLSTSDNIVDFNKEIEWITVEKFKKYIEKE